MTCDFFLQNTTFEFNYVCFYKKSCASSLAFQKARNGGVRGGVSIALGGVTFLVICETVAGDNPVTMPPIARML